MTDQALQLRQQIGTMMGMFRDDIQAEITAEFVAAMGSPGSTLLSVLSAHPEADLEVCKMTMAACMEQVIRKKLFAWVSK